MYMMMIEVRKAGMNQITDYTKTRSSPVYGARLCCLVPIYPVLAQRDMFRYTAPVHARFVIAGPSNDRNSRQQQQLTQKHGIEESDKYKVTSRYPAFPITRTCSDIRPASYAIKYRQQHFVCGIE